MKKLISLTRASAAVITAKTLVSILCFLVCLKRQELMGTTFYFFDAIASGVLAAFLYRYAYLKKHDYDERHRHHHRSPGSPMGKFTLPEIPQKES